jgi:uncharacterized protein (TIGR02001 family)
MTACRIDDPARIRAAIAAVVALAAAWCGDPAVAQTAEGPEASAQVEILSQYVWRGLVVNDEAVLQPAMTVGKGGFWIGAWGNFDLTDSVATEGEFSEIDLTAAYGAGIGPLAVEFGIVEYLFPNVTSGTNAAGATRELYVSVSAGTALDPTATVYYDFAETDGLYALLGVAHQVDTTETLGVELNLTVGYADADFSAFHFGADNAGLVDMTASVSAELSLSEEVILGVGGHYVTLLDTELKEAADKDDAVVVGVTVAYAF